MAVVDAFLKWGSGDPTGSFEYVGVNWTSAFHYLAQRCEVDCGHLHFHLRSWDFTLLICAVSLLFNKGRNTFATGNWFTMWALYLLLCFLSVEAEGQSFDVAACKRQWKCTPGWFESLSGIEYWTDGNRPVTNVWDVRRLSWNTTKWKQGWALMSAIIMAAKSNLNPWIRVFFPIHFTPIK